MFPLAPFIAALLAVMVSIAAYTDLKERRIPNWLVLAGLVLGFTLNPFLYGMQGLKNAAMGLGVAMLVYMPLYLLKGMGAGDVKLMAAVGAMVGPGNWLRIFILTALLGGVVAIGVILYNKGIKRAVVNVGRIIASPFRGKTPYEEYPELDVTSGQGVSLPHGAVIALASMVYLFLTMT